jgi:hypothetical protein
MGKRLARVGVCVLFAVVAAMIATVATYFLSWPPRWKHVTFDVILSTAELGAIVYAAVPLLALGVISIRRAPSALLAASISASWLVFLFLLQARKPWLYYGDFPWWMLIRVYTSLPISLAVGLAFAVAARKWLGPNNSFKPNPLRGSA